MVLRKMADGGQPFCFGRIESLADYSSETRSYPENEVEQIPKRPMGGLSPQKRSHS